MSRVQLYSQRKSLVPLLQLHSHLESCPREAAPQKAILQLTIWQACHPGHAQIISASSEGLMCLHAVCEAHLSCVMVSKDQGMQVARQELLLLHKEQLLQILCHLLILHCSVAPAQHASFKAIFSIHIQLWTLT